MATIGATSEGGGVGVREEGGYGMRCAWSRLRGHTRQQ